MFFFDFDFFIDNFLTFISKFGFEFELPIAIVFMFVAYFLKVNESLAFEDLLDLISILLLYKLVTESDYSTLDWCIFDFILIFDFDNFREPDSYFLPIFSNF